jgi:hypothetical protein
LRLEPQLDRLWSPRRVPAHEGPHGDREETGYILRVSELTVLGFTLARFPVNVFDLGHDDIDGLLGMNFLSDFNYDIRSSERRILVEKTGS